jgi:hypothetical protein
MGGRRLAGDAAGRRDGRGGGRAASQAGSGQLIAGCEERFRGPETHRRFVSGDRNGSGPGGLDCGKAVMRRVTYSSAGRRGERKYRVGRGRFSIAMLRMRVAAAGMLAPGRMTGPPPPRQIGHRGGTAPRRVLPLDLDLATWAVNRLKWYLALHPGTIHFVTKARSIFRLQVARPNTRLSPVQGQTVASPPIPSPSPPPPAMGGQFNTTARMA